MSKFVVVPQGKDSGSFLELAHTPKTKGRLFRKHILTEGVLNYGGQKFMMDSKFMDTLVKNFEDKKCDIVQVPIVDGNNSHSEDPLRNIGEVVGLEREGNKLYSLIDVRKEEAANELGNTLIGASAMLSTNYMDTSTATRVGPTLLHVAITNRPHVLNLEDFEEVIAASSDSSDEVILLSEIDDSNIVNLDDETHRTDEELEDTNNEENQQMTKEELLAELKEKFGVDVEAIEAELAAKSEEIAAKEAEVAEKAAEVDAKDAEIAEVTAESVALSNAVTEAFLDSGIIALSADETGTAAAIVAVKEATLKLSAQDAKITEQDDEIVELSNRISTIEGEVRTTEAAAAVDGLVAMGRIAPVQRDAMVELRLSNQELFDKIVPENPIFELSNEEGVEGSVEDEVLNASAEVKRLLGKD